MDSQLSLASKKILGSKSLLAIFVVIFTWNTKKMISMPDLTGLTSKLSDLGSNRVIFGRLRSILVLFRDTSFGLLKKFINQNQIQRIIAIALLIFRKDGVLSEMESECLINASLELLVRLDVQMTLKLTSKLI